MTTPAPRNNFTFIMIAAAALVAIRHSAILLGPDAPTAPLASMPAVGVFVLFAVSGYLVAGSWQRRPLTGRYLIDRGARIMPGLIAVTLFATCVIGPLTTVLSLGEYARHPLSWQYLLNILLNPQYALPGVFWDNPTSSAVNGTLWSIPAQLLAYLTIPLVGLVRPRSIRAAAWLLLAAATAALALLPFSADVVVWGSQLAQVCFVLPCFCLGAAVREYPQLLNVSTGAVALVVYAAIWIWVPHLLTIAGWTVLPIAVIALGRASFPVIRSAGRWGNPSYGIFLSGFVLQQTLIDGFGIEHAWVSLGLALVASYAFGSILLATIEQPTLRLVHRWTRRSPARPPESQRAEAPDPLTSTGTESGAVPAARVDETLSTIKAGPRC